LRRIGNTGHFKSIPDVGAEDRTQQQMLPPLLVAAGKEALDPFRVATKLLAQIQGGKALFSVNGLAVHNLFDAALIEPRRE
jgi:hypothetical protein